MSFSRKRTSFRIGSLALGVIGVALVTSMASAQVKDTTRKADTTAGKTLKHRTGGAKSDISVPVQKKDVTQQGEVAPPPPPVNQDSIDRANFVRDSLAAAAERERQEAAARAERERLAAIAAAERARQDSIAREEARLLKERRGRYGFYWGVGGGATVPVSNFSSAYGTGFNLTAPFGWDFRDSPLGIRADLAYDAMNGRSMNAACPKDVSGTCTVSISNVQVSGLNVDAKLRVKTQVFSYLDRLYVLAGAGVSRVWSSGGDDPGTIGSGMTNNGFTNRYNNAQTRLGWNAGVGMSFGFGSSAVFIESRYFEHSTDNAYMSNARFVPIIFGFTF